MDRLAALDALAQKPKKNRKKSEKSKISSTICKTKSGTPHNIVDKQRIPSDFMVPRHFQWYIAYGMLSLPATRYSMVIRFSVVR